MWSALHLMQNSCQMSLLHLLQWRLSCCSVLQVQVRWRCKEMVVLLHLLQWRLSLLALVLQVQVRWQPHLQVWLWSHRRTQKHREMQQQLHQSHVSVGSPTFVGDHSGSLKPTGEEAKKAGCGMPVITASRGKNAALRRCLQMSRTKMQLPSVLCFGAPRQRTSALSAAEFTRTRAEHRRTKGAEGDSWGRELGLAKAAPQLYKNISTSMDYSSKQKTRIWGSSMVRADPQTAVKLQEAKVPLTALCSGLTVCGNALGDEADTELPLG